VRDLAVTATSAFNPPNVATDDSPAAAPFGWSDLGSPFGEELEKAHWFSRVGAPDTDAVIVLRS